MKPCARFSPGNLRPALLVGGLAVHLASAPALHAREALDHATRLSALVNVADPGGAREVVHAR